MIVDTFDIKKEGGGGRGEGGNGWGGREDAIEGFMVGGGLVAYEYEKRYHVIGEFMVDGCPWCRRGLCRAYGVDQRKRGSWSLPEICHEKRRGEGTSSIETSLPESRAPDADFESAGVVGFVTG